jgi:hypothetical protein
MQWEAGTSLENQNNSSVNISFFTLKHSTFNKTKDKHAKHRTSSQILLETTNFSWCCSTTSFILLPTWVTLLLQSFDKSFRKGRQAKLSSTWPSNHPSYSSHRFNWNIFVLLKLIKRILDLRYKSWKLKFWARPAPVFTVSNNIFDLSQIKLAVRWWWGTGIWKNKTWVIYSKDE